MSDGERIERDKALAIAEGLVTWIESHCDKVEIAGSIRREKETVGDIEIVCQPHNPLALFQTLDKLVAEETIAKRLYRHVHPNKKVSYVPRWGERLRCFVLGGTTVELAIGDADNFGYLHWLRTGPAEANAWVMTQMMVEKAAMRFSDGYGWLADYAGQHPTYTHKVSLPDEARVFQCLGLDFIRPLWRSEGVYKAQWQGVLQRYLLDEFRVRELKQKRLL